MFLAMVLAGTGSFISMEASRMQGSGESARSPVAPSSAKQIAPPSGGHIHKITVKFDYDFTRIPACDPPKVKEKCIAQFNIYDISAGIKSRTRLFSMPAPAGETKRVSGITATSSPRNF